MSPSPSPPRRPGASVSRHAARAVLSTQPDARLVALARNGSEGAFEEIVRRHRAALLRYSRSIVTEGAEDAVQHAFLNAHRALSRGDEAIDLRPWLYRLTHNAAVDAKRRQGPATAPLDVQIDGVEQPHDALMKREALNELVTQVARLPERQREALVLRELEGRGHAEIAELLGVSGGAVRQLIHRARGTLRSAAALLFPPGLVERLAGTADQPARMAEIVTGGAGLGIVVVKGGAAVLATGALVIGGLEVSGAPGGDRGRASARVPVSTAPGTPPRPAPEPPGSASRPRALTVTGRTDDVTTPAPRGTARTELSSRRSPEPTSSEREGRAGQREGETVTQAPATEPADVPDPPTRDTDGPVAEPDDPPARPAADTEPDASEAPEDVAVSDEVDAVVSDESARSDLAEPTIVEPLDDEPADEPTD